MQVQFHLILTMWELIFTWTSVPEKAAVSRVLKNKAGPAEQSCNFFTDFKFPTKIFTDRPTFPTEVISQNFNFAPIF